MDRIVKGKHLERSNPFKLHYFPDISAGYPHQSDAPQGQTDVFKPSRFETDPHDAAEQEIESADRESVSETVQLKIEQLEEQAYIKGYNEGKEAGTTAGLRQFSDVLSQAREYQKTLNQEAETHTVQLALAIAKKIIHHELKVNPAAVLGIVRAALKEVVAREHVKIKLCSQDLDFIKKHAAEEISDGFGIEKLRFESDDSISPGGCIIQTNLGDIDARIENQLESIAAAFEKIAQTRDSGKGSHTDPQ